MMEKERLKNAMEEKMNMLMVVVGVMSGFGGAMVHNSWILFIVGGFFLAFFSGIQKAAWCLIGIMTGIMAIWVLSIILAYSMSMEIDLAASVVPFLKSLINPLAFLIAGAASRLVCKLGKEKSLCDS